MRGLYLLMNPLELVSKDELASLSPQEMISPYWNKDETTTSSSKKQKKGGGTLKVYLSTLSKFSNEMLIDEYIAKGDEDLLSSPSRKNKLPKSILLWESNDWESLTSLTKSILLTTSKHDTSPSFVLANKFLSQRQKEEESDDIMTFLSGEGIESASFILRAYQSISNTVSHIHHTLITTFTTTNDDDKQKDDSSTEEEMKHTPEIIQVPSHIWSKLIHHTSSNHDSNNNNPPLYIHVLLSRHSSSSSSVGMIDSYSHAFQNTQRWLSTNDVLFGAVEMIKYDIPHHIPRPKRKLYLDISHVVQKLVLPTSSLLPPPWDMSYWKPTEYKDYQQFLQTKHPSYPYWKPSVAIKLVQDGQSYPLSLADRVGMPLISIGGGGQRNPQYAYLPALHVDEIGLTSDKYVPLNQTITALPLYLSMDSSSEQNPKALTSSRWRLLSHLSQALESQKDLGVEQSDIDDIRRLIAETNVTLLTITILASTLHLLFEFLTFKNEVEFWRGNTDLTGLSVRALFMDFFSQTIILLYLIEKDSSLLMTLPSAAGCLIALWKCQRGAGFKFVKVTTTTTTNSQQQSSTPIWNKLLRFTGYELQATRLRAAAAAAENNKSSSKSEDKNSTTTPTNLAALTEEVDRVATQTLGKWFLLPLVLSYTMYTLIYEEHTGWYSWLITSASSAVYALGFVLMTPQLFLNYKLKSVAHLPWRVLCYRFINTFIDDLFAFIIRMPTMARISCFRDDVIFIIYLYQRYLYPVDTSRPVEGGGMDAVSAAASTAKIATEEDETKESKKNQ